MSQPSSVLEAPVAPAPAQPGAPLRLLRFREAMQQRAQLGEWARFPIASPFFEQQPYMYYPGLATRAVHGRERFPWLALLDEAFPDVVGELDGLLRRREGFKPVFERFTTRGAWAACLFWKHGRVNQRALEACPRTAEVLRSLPVTELGMAAFSALAPGTHLVPHCGMTNARLRGYLPLRVPEGCGLEIARRQVEVREGNAFIFDDSFVHTAWNDGDRPRFVLLFDLYHPDLTPDEVEVLEEYTESLVAPGGVPEPPETEVSPDWVYA